MATLLCWLWGALLQQSLTGLVFLGVLFFFLGCVLRVIPESSQGILGSELRRLPKNLTNYFSIALMASIVIMQPPIGVLVDRPGPRKVVAIGFALAVVSQFIFLSGYCLGSTSATLRSSLRLGQLGHGIRGLHWMNFFRVILGTAASFSFITALRLATAWLQLNRIGVLTQSTGEAWPLVELFCTTAC